MPQSQMDETQTSGESRGEQSSGQTAGESQSQAAGEVKAEDTAHSAVATAGTESGAATASEKSTTPQQGEAEGERGEGAAATAAKPERSKTAVGVEDYERMKADALSPKPATTGPAVVSGGESPGKTEEQKTSNAELPTSNAQVEEPPKGGTPSEAQGEGGGEEENKLPDRVRLGGLSDADKGHIVAAKAIATAEKIPFADALFRVTGKATAKAEGATGSETATETAATTEGASRTVEQIQADIAAKKAEKKDAAAQLDLSRTAEIDDELDTLRDELGMARRAVEEANWLAENERQTQFQTSVRDSKKRLLEAYPDAADDNSALSKEMLAIADVMEQQNNPLVYEADAPFKIGQMAANKRGIPPQSGPSKKESSTPAAGTRAAAPAKPQGVRQEAVVSKPAGGPAAAGSARTTSGGNGQTAIDPEKIRTVEDYEAVKAEVTGARR